MIDGVIGKIKSKGDNFFIISTGAIHYRVYASGFTLSQLEIGVSAEVYTEMVVREDDISLYGFITESERSVYRLLTTVSRIGPRVAIGILSGLSIDAIINAIRNQDVNTLTKAPGVGKKTAERIILELKDKTDHIEIENVDMSLNPIIEAGEALEHLGYSNYEVIDLLKDIYEEGMTVETLIKLVLQQIG